jgi:hypothetical protein
MEVPTEKEALAAKVAHLEKVASGAKKAPVEKVVTVVLVGKEGFRGEGGYRCSSNHTAVDVAAVIAPV